MLLRLFPLQLLQSKIMSIVVATTAVAAIGVVAAAELVGGDGPKLRRVCRDLWNCVRLFR